MNVHEYQGKEILRNYGVATPRGVPCFSVTEADAAARELGGKVWVVKAQIHAGGRGKGGGVKVAKSLEEVHEFASKILGMTLVTHQTGPEGRLVKRLFVEEGADIAKELYVGMLLDRATQRVTLMASSEGGMEIEEVAARTPEKIHKVAIDPVAGLSDAQADDIARKIGVPDGSVLQARKFMHGLYPAFVECDASLAEINPLIITGHGRGVDLCGGIMRCDAIAEGVIAAAKEVKLSVPLVVRMKGTNEELGRRKLRESGLPIISADNMADAAQKIVAAVAGK